MASKLDYLAKYTSDGAKKKKRERKKPRDGSGTINIRDDSEILPTHKKNIVDKLAEAGAHVTIVDEDDLLSLRRGKARHDSDGDLSPPRGKARHDSDGDLSPPPPKRADLGGDVSLSRLKPPADALSRLKPPAEASKDLSPPRQRTRANSDGNLSPPRQKTCADSDGDLSPPRAKPPVDANKDLSSPRQKARADSDGDLSPPRAKPPADASKDLSPPRQKARADSDGDLSPPRQKARADSDGDLSPPRKKTRHDADVDVPSPRNKSPSRDHQAVKMSSGLSAGLQSTEQVKMESDRIREARQDSELAKQSEHAETIYRSKAGKQITREEWMKSNEKKKKKRRNVPDQKLEWGGGLAQKKSLAEQQDDAAKLALEPLARYEIDQEYDAELIDTSRWNDPMARYTDKKETKEDVLKAKETAKTQMAKCRFPAPPNRFGIEPGYRWDGKIRGNGFESRWFKAKNSRQHEAQMISKLDTEDL
eukprot:GEMP01038838.1.p1 GENE.GEMP01038838.1~~GEMP01038838.1.p1  ORF type:complete len:478 (-),score=153.21 GEMP01038838.1:430-1863(-)